MNDSSLSNHNLAITAVQISADATQEGSIRGARREDHGVFGAGPLLTWSGDNENFNEAI